MNRRAVGFWVGLVGALLVVGLLTGGRQQSGPPLDPSSTEPTGTRALMIFLDELGADVVEGLPDATADSALMLADQLDDDSRAELDDWVADGGTLIVADPSSPLAPSSATFDGRDVLDSGECTSSDLQGLRIEASSFLLFRHLDPDGLANDGDDGPRFAATVWCFGDGTQSYLHSRPHGVGRVVALGGALTLTNEYLDEADNAVLAARLLLGDNESQTVAVLFDPVVAPGSRTLGDLIPSGAKWAAAQLVVAFGLYVLWRLPRFGRPVPEPQPVDLPASLLVRAAGELHRRSGGYGQASTTLREDLDRRLRRQLRVSPELPPAELVNAVAATGVITPDVVSRALTGPPAIDGDGLSALVADIDAVNRAVFARNGSATPTSNETPVGSTTDQSATSVDAAASITDDDSTIGARL